METLFWLLVSAVFDFFHGAYDGFLFFFTLFQHLVKDTPMGIDDGIIYGCGLGIGMLLFTSLVARYFEKTE